MPLGASKWSARLEPLATLTILVPLLLHTRLATAQSVDVPNGLGVSASAGAGVSAGLSLGGVLPTGCPSVLTLTVIPPDYTGSLLSLPTSLWPTLSTISLPLSLPSASVPDISTLLPQITGFSSLPTGLLPSATINVPSISFPVSALTPIVPLASGTPVSYACPEADGRVITQNGMSYAVSCGASAMGSVYSSVPAVRSFNDCFRECDQSSTDQGAKYCTGFSYEGVNDGQGSGLCELQNSVLQGFSQQRVANRVAGVRLLNYLAGGNAPLPTLSPTLPLTTQLPAVVTSLLGGLSSVLPSNIPLTTVIPNGLSSALGGITTGLPGVSSLVNDVTSLISDVTSELPDAASSLVDDITSGVIIPTDIPLTTELPNGVSSLVSDAINLPTLSISSALIAVSSILDGPDAAVSSLVGGITGALPTSTPVLPVSSLIGEFSSVLSPPGLPLSSIGGGLSSLLPNPTQGVPGVASSILNANTGGAVGSILEGLTSLPTSLSTALPLSGSITALTNVLPTALLQSISVPSLGTNVLTTTGADGLPTLLPITPSVLLPSLTVSSLPTSINPSAVPSLIPSTDLGGVITNLIPTLSAPSSSLSAPSLAISIQSPSSLSVPINLPSSANILPSVGLPSPSASAPTATAAPLFACPLDTNLAYISPSGQAFQILCNTQSLSIGSDISSALQPNLQTCINSCSRSQDCSSISYQSSTNICTLKSSTGQGVGATADFSTAVAIDLSCPNGNGVVYMDPSGSIYQILCNYTFPERSEISQVAVPAGRMDGLLAKRAQSHDGFLPCSVQCSVMAGCVAVTETNGMCIFISNLGPAGTGVGSTSADTVILVAKRMVSMDGAGQAQTSTSTPATVPTVATSRSATVYNPTTTGLDLGLSSALSGVPSLSASLPSLTAIPPSAGLSVSLGASASIDAGLSVSLASTDILGGIGATTTSSCQQGGVLGIGATPCSVTSSTSMTSSTSRSQVVVVVPVTTLVTTSTVTACSTNLLNQVVCPTVSVVETVVGSRTITQSASASTSSTFSTSIRTSLSSATSSRVPSSSISSRAAASSTSSCVGLLGLGC